jgi:NADH-quinone oxidoreductase subunit A
MIAILGLVALMLLLNKVLGPKPVDSAVKLEPFECGATPVDPRNVKAVPASTTRWRSSSSCSTWRPCSCSSGRSARSRHRNMLVTFAIFMFLLVLILLYVYRARLLEGVTE